jgi:hypothetical protein
VSVVFFVVIVFLFVFAFVCFFVLILVFVLVFLFAFVLIFCRLRLLGFRLVFVACVSGASVIVVVFSSSSSSLPPFSLSGFVIFSSSLPSRNRRLRTRVFLRALFATYYADGNFMDVLT